MQNLLSQLTRERSAQSVDSDPAMGRFQPSEPLHALFAPPHHALGVQVIGSTDAPARLFRPCCKMMKRVSSKLLPK